MTPTQLSEDQVKTFDTDYFTDLRLGRIFACLERDFGEREFRLLDIGCGNGRLVDRILERFPAALAVVVDNSPHMIDANRPHPRKQAVLAEATELASVLEGRRFDVISLNWILHHLVYRSWSASRTASLTQLRHLHRLATPEARLSVYENCYDGLLFDNLPGRIIHGMTSTPLLSAIARSQGANTAGVGVSFQSRQAWTQQFSAAGWAVQDELTETPWHPTLDLKLALVLHLKKVYCNHFWLHQT